MSALLGLSKPLAALRGADPLRVRFLALLTAGHMINHWHQSIYPVVVPTIKAALGLTDVEVGAMSSARQLVSTVLNLPIGMLADALGRQRGLILGSSVVLGGLAYAILGTASGYGWALLGSVLIGLSISAWHPVALSSIAMTFADRRGAALAIHGTGATLMDSVTPLIVGALLAVFAWQGVLGFQLLPALVVALVMWRALAPVYRGNDQPAPRTAGIGAQMRDIGSLLANPAWLGITGTAALWSAGRIIVLTFLPIYLQEDLGYSTVVLGFYIALLNVLGIASQTILGLLSDRFGRKAVLLPSYLLLGVLYVLLAYAPPGWALGAVIAAIGIFFYTLANVSNAAMFDVVETKVAASAQGLSSMVSSLLTLPAPIVAGLMVGAYGIGSTFLLSGALMFTGALVMLPLRMYRGRRAA